MSSTSTDSGATAPRPLPVRFAWHAIIWVAALPILAAFLHPVPGGGIDAYDRARFSAMVDGTAYRPFVTRPLLPAAVRVVVGAFPRTAAAAAARVAREDPWMRRVFRALGWDPASALALFVAGGLLYLCFVGFAYAAADLAQRTTCLAGGEGTRTLLSVGALGLLPPLFGGVSYLYDPPQLLLYTAALAALARFALAPFALLFLAAAFNKETSILLLVVFAVVAKDQTSRRRWMPALGLLFLAFAAVRLWLLVRFAGSPGSMLEFHLIDHNLTLGTAIRIAARGAYVALLMMLAFWGWRRRPPFLKSALLATLLPLVTAGMFFGYVEEWRDYLEAYPIVFALVVDFFARLRRSEERAGAAAP